MIGDLIALFETVRTAQGGQEKADREAALDKAVRTEIHALFDDPKYPKRRRTFGSIRKPLAIFDDSPEALTKILFEMGARRVRGVGDYALWTLAANSEDGVAPLRPSRRWQSTAIAIGLLAIIGLAIMNFDTLRAYISGQNFASKSECLATANGNMRRISECERLFP